MHYLIWIPLCIISYIFLAFASLKNSQSSGAWFYAVWGQSILPLWALVSLKSNNIVFDGLLFDTIMILSYTIAATYFSGHVVSLKFVAGILISILGLFIIRTA